MTECWLGEFEGTFAELEPDFDAFVRRFTKFDRRDPDTSRYGRWLNPVGYWDWWELGGRFNGAITGERRPAGAEQAISSGLSRGRAILGNVVTALGGSACGSEAEIEANVELVASLRRAGDQSEKHTVPTALVLPMGCCADEDRWFDNVGWHEIRGNFLARRPMRISGVWCGRLMSGFRNLRLLAWRITFEIVWSESDLCCLPTPSTRRLIVLPAAVQSLRACPS
jgi:hypothetical protein